MSFGRSRASSLRFQSFVDNMGENIDRGTEERDVDPDMAWLDGSEHEHGNYPETECTTTPSQASITGGGTAFDMGN